MTGEFEVELNGDLIFSKKKEGRFPTVNELYDLIKTKIWFDWKRGYRCANDGLSSKS